MTQLVSAKVVEGGVGEMGGSIECAIEHVPFRLSRL